MVMVMATLTLMVRAPPDGVATADSAKCHAKDLRKQDYKLVVQEAQHMSYGVKDNNAGAHQDLELQCSAIETLPDLRARKENHKKIVGK